MVDWLGLRYIASEEFRPHQLLAHLFVHAGFLHLFSNMFTLVTFGPVLEYTLSSKRFLALYLLTGIGAALLYMAVFYFEISKLTTSYHHYMESPTPEAFAAFLHKAPQMHTHYHAFVSDFLKHSEDGAYIARSKAIATQLYTYKLNMPIVGASGAIFGLLTAFALLFPTATLSLFFLPIPIKAKYFVILYGIYELYAGLRDNPADNVAHFAHLGGIVFAYLFIRWYKRRQP
jgi:membrane associated rhomboid family serine protease